MNQMASRVLSVKVVNSVLRSLRHSRAFLDPKCFAYSAPVQRFASYNRNQSVIPQRATFDSELQQPVFAAESDPDKFGDWSQPDKEDEQIDEGDVKEEEYLQNPPTKSQKLRTKQYADMIKEHLQYNRLKEAIDVLEVRMLKQDRVQPENYIYNLLISGCARAGYSRKAFQLYNKMKQRDLKVTGGTYTSLFNACANAPWIEDGLNKANKLREIMLEKGYEPKVSNYNAMIKAYGRCNDVQTAFVIADEMTEKRLPVRVDTYNFLLQACISDKDLGFRHALLVWHKMHRRRLIPDIYSFNLLLRCVRDCSVGDLAELENLVTKILSPKKPLPYLSDPHKSPVIAESDDGESSLQVIPREDADAAPNLLSANPHLGNLVSISEITKPEDRLLLLGGQSGFLEEMKKAKVTPGIETFTALLEVVPSTNAAEKNIISMIRRIGLKADINFFNVLIKKRSMRFDYQGAKEVLSMIRTAKLQPDLITYGVLALGCRTQEEARELLDQMQQKGIRMNIQILGAMLKQGSMQRNFDYIYEIMQISLDQNIRPNEDFLRHLHNFQNSCYKLIEQDHPASKTRNFRKNFTTYKNKFKKWRTEYDIEGLKLTDAIQKLKENPYKQFKENIAKGFEGIKNEDLQRKQKIRKYIKKIKMDQLPDDSKDDKYSNSNRNLNSTNKLEQ